MSDVENLFNEEVIIKKKYVYSNEIRTIAEDIVFSEEDFTHIRSIFNEIYFQKFIGKKKGVLGTCSTINTQIKDLLSDHDANYSFIITIMSDTYDNMDEDMKRTLIRHELRHISKDLKIRGHNIETFIEDIIDLVPFEQKKEIFKYLVLQCSELCNIDENGKVIIDDGD